MWVFCSHTCYSLTLEIVFRSSHTCLACSLSSSHLLFSDNCFRGGRKRKTMKLSRDLSNLVVFTNSVASQECLNEGKLPWLWLFHKHKLLCWALSLGIVFTHLTIGACAGTPADVLSFSETRAQSLVNHRAEQFLAFNQRQLSRIYPSAYRIDSSNFNPQFYWNVGCQLGKTNVPHVVRGVIFFKMVNCLCSCLLMLRNLSWVCTKVEVLF